MNERIESLIELSEVWNTDGDVDKCEVDLYKFAELIIRNCIEQAHSVGDLRGVNDDMIYGADYAAVQISKYFGVE